MHDYRLLLVTNDDVWGDTIGRAFVVRGYQVVRAQTAAAALKEGALARPDAVLVDLELPDLSGAALCISLRSSAWSDETTPIVVSTVPDIGDEQRLALLHAGAWDVVRSSATPDELATRVEHYLGARRVALRARQEGLIDSATGLYNDQGLARRAEELVADAFRRHAALACLAVAPDWQGDGASVRGDAESVALRLAETLQGIRKSDVTGREAPGEFVILAPRTDALGAVGLARRLRNAVSAMFLRVGYDAVPNVRESSTSSRALIQAAREALRRVPLGSHERPIQPYRPFEHRPPHV